MLMLDSQCVLHYCVLPGTWLPLCLYDSTQPQVSLPDDFITRLSSTTVRHVDTAEALSTKVMMVLPHFPIQWAPMQVHHNAVRGHHTALQRTKTQEYMLTRLERATCPSQPFLVSTAYKTPLHTITWIQQRGIHLEDQTSHVPFILPWQDFIRIQ